MKITLCICTMNRPIDLENCLNAIFKATCQPDEIIVSDDSQDGNPTQRVVDIFPEVIYQEGPHRGLGPNRNACIRSTTGDHLIFIDDDVCVATDFIQNVQALLAVVPEKTIITGYELNHLRGFPEKIKPHNADFWGFQKVAVTDTYRSIVINASVFPSQLFQEISFDENLRYGCDEIDVAQHATALGYEIEYSDEIHVNHYPSPINRDHYKRFANASRIYIMTKSYWKYDKSIPKAVFFLIFSPLQIMGSSVRHRDKGQFLDAFYSFKMAIGYLSKSNLIH